MDATSFLATVIASAAGTLFAAVIGYRFAISRFRRERAFDRRLGWYEVAIGKLLEAANRLNWALAGDIISIAGDARRNAWSDAYQSLLGLRGLEIEAQLYATRQGHRAVSDVVGHVTAIARAVMMLGERSAEGEWQVPTRLFEIERKLMLHAAATLASDVRAHLGLEEIDREWSIYDEELTQLHEELERYHAQVQAREDNQPYGGIVPKEEAVLESVHPDWSKEGRG